MKKEQTTLTDVCMGCITIISTMLVITCASNFLIPIGCAITDQFHDMGRKVAEKIEYSGRK